MRDPALSNNFLENVKKMKITKLDCVEAIRAYLLEDCFDSEEVLDKSSRLIVELFQKKQDTIEDIKKVILMASCRDDVEVV